MFESRADHRSVPPA